MDTSALHLIIEMLSRRTLIDFLIENFPNSFPALAGALLLLPRFLKFMDNTRFMGLPQEQKQALIERVRLTAHKVGNFVSEIVGRKVGSVMRDDLVKDWREIIDLLDGMIELSNYPEELVDYLFEGDESFEFDLTERIEKMLLETTDCSNYQKLNEKQSRVLLLKKAIPYVERTDAERIPNHVLLLKKLISEFEHTPIQLINIIYELGGLPEEICKACEGKPLALLLIGGLLSLKPMAYDIWSRVRDELVKIKESNNCVMMWHIINYCYNDLPYSLKLCFLYFACYPIGYEIPATSLIDIWIAEGFVTPEKEKTREEIANKYLEQLVQRSLVCVSKRSFLGTIKTCRIPRLIHDFAIQQSDKDEFMVVNPDQEKIESMFRLAIHHSNKKQYTEVKKNHIHSFLAFNYDSNILGSAVLLRVLELRESAIPVLALPSNMISLQYLGLRGSNICELPENIGDMKDLQTLDVRDTKIETLPESLWTISKLCHVFVKPSTQIKGPPSTTFIPNLHILKTVGVHESWQENIPHFLINLRKLALSNWDNLNWKSISNLLSHIDKLITMSIIGNIIPSEFADIRAFPKLETVKSIKLEGQWKYCWNLPIDNYKFPPNLTKLTLTNSGLKEDPMPTLGRLQALKLLRLQDGAYIGNQMVCSANGFPQLQFLKLKKLENLANWVVEPNAMLQLQFLKLKKLKNLTNWEVEQNAMSQLTTLHVVQCGKLNYPSNLNDNLLI